MVPASQCRSRLQNSRQKHCNDLASSPRHSSTRLKNDSGKIDGGNCPSYIAQTVRLCKYEAVVKDVKSRRPADHDASAAPLEPGPDLAPANDEPAGDVAQRLFPV